MKSLKEIINLIKTDKFFDVCLGLVVGGVLGISVGIGFHKDIPTMVGGTAVIAGVIGLAYYA